MATVDDKKVIFSMVGVSKTIQQNQKQVLKNIYLSFFYGAKIGIIGLNGAGKSTLMKIIAGLDQQYQGNVVWSPGYSVGYLPQDPPLNEEKTVKENVMEGVQHVYDALAEYDEINVKFGLPEYYEDADKMDKLMQRQAELQDIIDATDAWNMDSKLDRAMAALNCPPGDWSVKNLSGGERRRVALCRLLLQKPDVLLLDEPTNHLDAESIDWLEQHLQQYEGTVIAVTHDRYFLDDVAEWILELDRGEGIPWKGNYSSWLEQKSQRLAQEEKSASKRRKTLERELEWVRMAPKARHAKGKARLNSYEMMLNEEQKQKEEKLEIFIPNGPRLGNKVIEAEHVAKSYPEKTLFTDLNFNLPPNGIVGVIGPNGAGKTTLFRLIMGLEQADAGQFAVGETVKLSYVDQQHKDIDPAKSVYEVVSGGNETIRMGGKDVNVRAYLSRFNFSGADQEKKCGVLSGGERNRLHLAIALKQEGNVLLLDEPTNDIDVNTLRALEEGLEAFAGCAVIISHDRWFLDRICTHILAFEGEGNVFYFEGNYSVGMPKYIILGVQHLFAMFGATVLVPVLTGLSVSSTLLFAGIGTLVFHCVSKFKVPAFLGSSFAFLGGYLSVKALGVEQGMSETLALDYACIGVLFAGLCYFVMAGLIKSFGIEKMMRFFPPLVTGPMIIAIGLVLSGSAIQNCTTNWTLAIVALATVIIASVCGKGIIRIIPILLGVVVSYTVAVVMGEVDFSSLGEAAWIGLPFSREQTVLAVFDNMDSTFLISTIIAIMPIAIATIMEHIGDMCAISSTVGKDFLKEPGLHRTLMGDGLATAIASLFGAPANTTYGENTGVLNLTKVFDPAVIRLAACFAILLSFCPKFACLIGLMPAATIGGVSLILYGMISAVGVRNLIEDSVDFNSSRNVFVAALILVIAIGVKYGADDNVNIGPIHFSGLALSAIVGVTLNAILPGKLGMKIKSVHGKENK